MHILLVLERAGERRRGDTSGREGEDGGGKNDERAVMKRRAGRGMHVGVIGVNSSKRSTGFCSIGSYCPYQLHKLVVFVL